MSKKWLEIRNLRPEGRGKKQKIKSRCREEDEEDQPQKGDKHFGQLIKPG